MMFDFDDLKNAGIDVTTGIGFTGSNEKYFSAIQRFYAACDENASKLSGFVSDNDLKNYSITVHAVKSNAKMIGAQELSDLALQLEMASKEENGALVNELHGKFLERYSSLKELLRKYGEMERVKAPGELDAMQARQTAEDLLAALDDFDDDKAAELAEKLLGYPFRITQKQMLKEAIDAIDDFMYDEATELINMLMEYIE